MKVLLCGGAGYIGTHVALACLEQGIQTGVYDNFSSGLRSNVLPECEIFEGDILDEARLDEVMARGWDAVVHLAAFKAAGESMLDPVKYSKNNITGSLNMIAACVKHKVPSFLLSSSAAVYGEPVRLPMDETHPTDPENYYGYTKLAIERHLEWYAKLTDLTYTSLRYFNAAGYDPKGRMTGLEPNPANLIPVVMEAAVGMRPEVCVFGDDYDTPDGTGVRDYIHVTDLADGHVKALQRMQETGESLTVNLGSEQGLSVMEIIDATRRISGRDFPVSVTGRRAGDPGMIYAAASKALETLGWKATHSDLETIIRTTWDVYKLQLD